MSRITKNSYYLNLALEVSRRGTCLRRNYGAIVVKHDQVISTGYTGAPRGRVHCCDIRICERIKQNIPKGQRYELCRSVHAEQNAIIHASRMDLLGSIMYINGTNADSSVIDGSIVPCEICKKMIINAGISSVITPSGEYSVQRWIEDENIDIY